MIDAANYEKPSQEVLKESLSEESYRVTQESATEAPFTNAYDQTFEEGIYVDITTGEPLFLPRISFASGCGWPSFSRPISKELIHYYKDMSHGMERIEVRSRSGNAHLGHVFTDGPQELGGLRYCINSAFLTLCGQGVRWKRKDMLSIALLKQIKLRGWVLPTFFIFRK